MINFSHTSGLEVKIGLELGKLKFFNLGVVLVPALVSDAGDLDGNETAGLSALDITVRGRRLVQRLF